MDNLVFAAVFFAAFLHAFWNFLVKGNQDKALAMIAVSLGHLPLGMAGLFWAIVYGSGLPPLAAWPYIAGSAVLHTAYQIFLMHAYRFGALSHIYPIARGVSPLLLVAGSLLIGQDNISPYQGAGIVIIAAALISLGVMQFRQAGEGPVGLLLALITGLFIASYSMADALGTRLADSALAYYGVMSGLNSLLLALWFWRFHRAALIALPGSGKQLFWIGGSASWLAYVLVLWACLGTPVAVVSSLRETSVIIAMLLGVLLLKERFTPAKLLACCAVLAGSVLMRLG